MSEEEIPTCIFDAEILCSVRKELQKESDMSALMDRVLKPDSSSNNTAPYLQFMDKMGRALSKDFTVLPRFCEICLKYKLSGIKNE